MLRLINVLLQDIGCFENFSVQFSTDTSIICGANGIGKTSILDAIGSYFSPPKVISSTRSALASSGKITAEYSLDGARFTPGNALISDIFPYDGLTLSRYDQANVGAGVKDDHARWILHFKSNRNIEYSMLKSIDADPVRDKFDIGVNAARGISNSDLKKWLANRVMFQPHGSLNNLQAANLEFATSLFSILDNTVKFGSIIPNRLDITVTTNDGEIPFEYLSSGFRSSLYMLLGVIKEVEHRNFSTPAHEFPGVILIDEIDLHLHPFWQQRIVPVFRETFPKAQLIATTHSPHVVQSAAPAEIIALVRNAEGRPERREIRAGRFGFQGWTIEEILTDVMGMASTRTDTQQTEIHRFEKGIRDDNETLIQEALRNLEEMLHPASDLRKLLRLQAAPYIEDKS